MWIVTSPTRSDYIRHLPEVTTSGTYQKWLHPALTRSDYIRHLLSNLLSHESKNCKNRKTS